MKWRIPGTVLQIERENADGVEEMFSSMFLAGGMVLSQVASITGLEPHTVQNWVKRGYLTPPQKKKYTQRQLCRILIINMLRSCMQLDKIDFLIHYINGEGGNESDDIIRDSELYDYICRILDALVEQNQCSFSSIRTVIEQQTAGYTEVMEGARERLTDALEAIVVAYYATLIKTRSDALVNRLVGNRE